MKNRSYKDLPRTLDELAEEMGVSRQRVLQIEKRALAKLRRALIRKGYHSVAMLIPEDHETKDTNID